MNQTNMSQISKEKLLNDTQQLASEERRITAKLIQHLQEIDRRRLHLELGYGSLFDFVTRHLHYSESSAQRRIDAMRLSREIPEVRHAVESGTLTLSTVGQLQKFFRHEQKEKQKSYSADEKRELLHQMEGLSSRECERTLASLSPTYVQTEKTRAVSETHTQVSFTADTQLMADLERLKNLWAHQIPHFTYAQLFAKMAQIALNQADPLRKKVRPQKVNHSTAASAVNASHDAKANPDTNAKLDTKTNPDTKTTEHKREHEHEHEATQCPPSKEKSQYIPAADRRHVWRKDEARCAYISPQTGLRCRSSYMLEIDHIDAQALGGSNDPENLRLLCRNHNQLHAVQTFGAEKMAQFRKVN